LVIFLHPLHLLLQCGSGSGSCAHSPPALSLCSRSGARACADIQALTDKKSAPTREAACSTISTLCENGAAQLLEPYIISSDANTPFPTLLEAFADKDASVKTAALAAVKAVVQTMNPWATFVILPALLEQIQTAGKWQVKHGSLEILQQLINSAPVQMAQAMPDLIPVLAGAVWDTKADVKKAAKVTLEKATALCANKDVSHLLIGIVSCAND
jgi:elongation factor 3